MSKLTRLITIIGLLTQFNLSPREQDIIILAFIGIGYLVTEFAVLPLTRRKQKKAMDETNGKLKEHYDLYIERCKSELEDLFETLRANYHYAYGEAFNVPVLDGVKWGYRSCHFV